MSLPAEPELKVISLDQQDAWWGLTAEPQLGEQPEEQLHAVLVVRRGREGGQTSRLQQTPNPDHHQHLPQHRQGRPVPHEAEPGPDHGALRGARGHHEDHTRGHHEDLWIKIRFVTGF